MKLLSTLLTLLICAASAFSQQTGRFDITISHLEEDRTVSLYVHPDYDPTKAYDVIIMLHGLGDKSSSMANFAEQVVAQDSAYKNCIYIAPDGGDDPNRDFYAPKEDITIIDKCIEYVKENYSVDNNRIFLEGFSLGARSAMCYGLNNPSKFSGLILNTPAVQGPKDAMNMYADSSVWEHINYKNASQIPMLITNGTADVLYVEPIEMAVDSLMKYNGKVIQLLVPDMAHTIPYQSLLFGRYMFNEGMIGNDIAEVIEIDNPENTLYAIPNFDIKFRNVGENTVSSCKFVVANEEQSKEYTWNGTIEPFEVTIFDIEFPNMTAGMNNFEIILTEVNGSALESPDTTIKHIFYTEESNSLPYTFDFEKDNPSDSEWSIEESASLEGWEGYSDDETTCAVKYTNTTLMIFNYDGFQEDLISPYFDLTTATNPILVFDLLHNYFRYNYQGEVYEYGDTLVVSISTDGGETFEELYSKTKEELATYDEPFTDIQQQTFIYNVVPTKENWRQELISLSDYADATNAQFKFTIKNAMGGITMIDNFKLDSDMAVEDNNINSDITIYPNPTADYITVDTDLIKSYKVVDMLGNDLTSGVQAEGKTLNVSSLVSGTYTLILNGKAHNFVVSK